MPEQLDVAVVGAGPHGLSVAAHLTGLRTRIFGAPMHTWRTLMPPGMKLRSTWEETSFPAPGNRGSVEHWSAATGTTLTDPPTLTDFVAYADWFLANLAGAHDPDDVTDLTSTGSGSFALRTSSGTEMTARRVVIAVGVTPFGQVPAAFAALLDDPAVTFATEQTDFSRFRGRRVAILGGGQGALEAALWCVRAEAEVSLLVRSQITWFADREPWNDRSPLRQRLHELAYPVVGYGPPIINRIAIRPGAFARLPTGVRHAISRRVLRSGGSPWLREEVQGGARIAEGITVVRAARSAEHIELALSDGSTLTVDHVLLGTGYAFSLDRLAFLSPELRSQIALAGGFPALDEGYTSTARGLHFVGYAAEGHAGPAARFVLGARHAAPAVARAVRGG